jgi:tRNA1(Val) A37 N6-methylase TrmN6
VDCAVTGQRARDRELTDDAFLGGSLRILQPRSGYRAGLDAVMLAAAVPAQADRAHRVLDVGAGVGTAGLCLARRDALAHVTLLERERELVRVAEENVERNGLSARVRVVEGDLSLSTSRLRALGLEEESFDHVMANPPFHEQGEGTAAPDALKSAAHAMPQPELERWARFLARMAVPGGGATLIHKAEALLRLLPLLEGRFGALKVLPLHPRASSPAHRIIVQGFKGSRAPPMLLPGFVLHGADAGFTPQAQAILRAGSALPMTPAL